MWWAIWLICDSFCSLFLVLRERPTLLRRLICWVPILSNAGWVERRNDQKTRQTAFKTCLQDLRGSSSRHWLHSWQIVADIGLIGVPDANKAAVMNSEVYQFGFTRIAKTAYTLQQCYVIRKNNGNATTCNIFDKTELIDFIGNLPSVLCRSTSWARFPIKSNIFDNDFDNCCIWCINCNWWVYHTFNSRYVGHKCIYPFPRQRKCNKIHKQRLSKLRIFIWRKT